MLHLRRHQLSYLLLDVAGRDPFLVITSPFGLPGGAGVNFPDPLPLSLTLLEPAAFPFNIFAFPLFAFLPPAEFKLCFSLGDGSTRVTFFFVLEICDSAASDAALMEAESSVLLNVTLPLAFDLPFPED